MYRKSNKGWLKHIDFLIIDMISLEISFFLAYMIRHGFYANLVIRSSYYHMIFVLLLIDFVSMAMMRTFSGVIRRGYFEEFKASIRQASMVTLLSAFYLFSIQEGEAYSRIILVLTGVLYLFIGYFSRCLWRIYLDIKRSSHNERALILITTRADASKMLQNFEHNNYSRSGITGLVILDESLIGETINGIEVVADLNTVEDYMLSHWVDEALFGIPVDKQLVYQMEKTFLEMGITVHQSLMEVQNDSPIGRHIERIGGYTVITRSIRILSFGEILMKRALDILGGIVGSICTGILFLFVAPAIYIASPGPIFFTQNRIGKNGKVFKMFKFRSMYLDAEERKAELMEQNRIKNGLMFKMEYDPRIIGSEKGKNKGIGNFIRRTSIDEFPQFLNVLKGDMSLVGTRPPTLEEWENYENHHRTRMATRPGITGMWQVSGRSNITDFEEVVNLDMEYIENWSFGLDIKILVKTVVQVLKHEGAA